MLIIGIHYYGHSTSVALFKNNKILFAIEEERVSRIKNDGSIPFKSMQLLLNKFKLKINDISAICFATIPEELIKEKYLKFTYEEYEKAKNIFFEDKSLENIKFLNKFKNFFIEKTGYKNKIFFFNHHQCHLMASYYLSGYKSALCISIDGLGEIESTVISTIKNNKYKLIKSINYPNSLGKVYEAITDYLGFNHSTSAGTVMALAALGNYKKKINNKKTYYQIFKEIIKKTPTDIYKVDTTWFNYPYSREGWVSKKFLKFFGPRRNPKSKIFTEHHKNIASALQKRFEDIYLEIIKFGIKRSKLKNLTLSGGCALNCKANGELNGLKLNNIYIQPASGDAGLSIGAAKIGYELLKKNKKFDNKEIIHTYFGSNISDNEILSNLNKRKFKFIKCNNIEEVAANLIYKNKIIGWVQGKSEFGPRALGNRSIIARPDSKEIKNYINSKIKKREYFRPFAPAILKDEASKYYKLNFDSPFMLMACKIKNEKRKQLLGTIHFDNTARVQTVTKKTNLKFFNLIKAFQKKSGIPIVLNTSFNGKGVPIVNNAKDAIDEFACIKLDFLIINDFLIFKKNKIKNLKKVGLNLF